MPMLENRMSSCTQLHVVADTVRTAPLRAVVDQSRRAVQAQADVTHAMTLRATRRHALTAVRTTQRQTTITMQFHVHVHPAENEAINQPPRRIQEVLNANDLDAHE